MSDELVKDLEWDEISGPRPETPAERLRRMQQIETELNADRQLDVVSSVPRRDALLWAWLVRGMRP